MFLGLNLMTTLMLMSGVLNVPNLCCKFYVTKVDDFTQWIAWFWFGSVNYISFSTVLGVLPTFVGLNEVVARSWDSQEEQENIQENDEEIKKRKEKKKNNRTKV